MIFFLTGGLIVLGFTAFFEPILNEFGWSYTQVSLATSFRGAEVGLIAPVVGLIIDRRGPRWIMFWGLVLLGFGLILMSRTTSIGVFYIAFVMIAIGMSGVSPTVVATAVANWFRRKIGITSGIMFSGFAFAGLLVPLVVKIIDLYGWRMAAIIITIIIWIIGLPLSLLVRHRPEQYGYVPDGDKPNAAVASEKSAREDSVEINISAKQAVKSRAFWHIGIAMALHFNAIAALIIHVMPYLGNIGFDRSTAGLVAMSVSLITVVGRLSCGWLSDKFNKVKVTTVYLTLSCVGLLFFSFAQVNNLTFIILFCILTGTGWGGIAVARTTLLREYFGRNAFGTIFGFCMGLTAIGVILGPLFTGLIFDTWGSYRPAWLMFTGLVFIGVVSLVTIPRKTGSLAAYTD